MYSCKDTTHILRTGRNDKLNISLYYRTHGLPFRLQGPPVICPYITDVIDAMETGGSDVLIIISLGLHYLEYHLSFFIRRLLGIKQAILRHLEKHPNTKFIIKGLNLSLAPHYPFEWLVLRYDLLLKEILKLEKIVFIDLWDMTTVWPIAYYHPVEKILYLLNKRILCLAIFVLKRIIKVFGIIFYLEYFNSSNAKNFTFRFICFNMLICMLSVFYFKWI